MVLGSNHRFHLRRDLLHRPSLWGSRVMGSDRENPQAFSSDASASELPAAWIVVNIGCIECGVPSNIVGVFTSANDAEMLALELGETHAWREGGQNAFEVFPMPALNVVSSEYLSDGLAQDEIVQPSRDDQ